MQFSSRRDFLKFIGVSSIGTLIPSLPASVGFASGTSRRKTPFTPLSPSNLDDFKLASGFEYNVIIKQGDPLSEIYEFGDNNDYTATLPLHAKDLCLLWSNHEHASPLFVGRRDLTNQELGPTKEQIDREQRAVGGSFVVLQKDPKNQKWNPVKNAPLNWRIDAKTPIPFVSDKPIAGKKGAIGTLANCAGGVTPWGTILTCEENYENYYGEVYRLNGKRTYRTATISNLEWYKHYPFPPEHYGWVVEVNPHTKSAKKLTALGRFAHESATCVKAKDGTPVVYSGDDDEDQCLYKFISSSPFSLDKGELFVADTLNGKWVSLDIKKQSVLQKHFKDQLEVLIYCREAAQLVGGTPLDRPEDIEVNPHDQSVLISLTNNKAKGNYHGSILKIEEEDGSPLSLKFKASTFLTGGKESGFSCPDNLVFDKNKNLWIATDIATGAMNKSPYQSFKNNGLFYVPMRGQYAGQVFQVASAPVGAELTGLSFSPDHQLILSVQHPGQGSKSINNPVSHWPTGGTPRSSVIAIHGELMERLVQNETLL